MNLEDTIKRTKNFIANKDVQYNKRLNDMDDEITRLEHQINDTMFTDIRNAIELIKICKKNDIKILTKEHGSFMGLVDKIYFVSNSEYIFSNTDAELNCVRYYNFCKNPNTQYILAENFTRYPFSIYVNNSLYCSITNDNEIMFIYQARGKEKDDEMLRRENNIKALNELITNGNKWFEDFDKAVNDVLNAQAISA